MVVGLVVLLHMARPARAHEHEAGESAERARVIEFYRSWLRPKGNFSVEHRVNSCCFGSGSQQDCFPVEATRKNAKGELEVMPDVSEAATEAQANYGAKWYTLDTGVEEDKQPDPRESPDGRSHVCIVGNYIVCYVPGQGS
jgi:hypothetical protein